MENTCRGAHQAAVKFITGADAKVLQRCIYVA